MVPALLGTGTPFMAEHHHHQAVITGTNITTNLAQYEEEEEDNDILIMDTEEAGGGVVTESPSDTVLHNLPPMVSITRVPKTTAPKPLSEPVVSSLGTGGGGGGGGLKIRTDLNSVPTAAATTTSVSSSRAGVGPPPPLLRVAGGMVPALPPMPRLRLGGVRGTGPPAAIPHQKQRQPHQMPYSGNSPLNGMLNMMAAGGVVTAPPTSFANHLMMNHHHHRVPPISQQSLMMMGQEGGRRMAGSSSSSGSNGGLPVIAGTKSLQNMQRQRQLARQLQRAGQGAGGPVKQRTAFSPALGPPTSRPVQVRTVFVPPPMTMKNSGLTPGSALTPTPPRMINSFPLSSPPSSQSGITITPISNGKYGTLLFGDEKTPPIRTAPAASREGGIYNTMDIDDDIEDDIDVDDGLDDEDDEYNEITEAPPPVASSGAGSGLTGGSLVPVKNLLADPPNLSGSVTLHRLVRSDKPPVSEGPPAAITTITTTTTHTATTSSTSTVGAAETNSRRNSVDSVGSGSTAVSVDSVGQPRPATAKKSFKPNSNHKTVNGHVAVGPSRPAGDVKPGAKLTAAKPEPGAEAQVCPIPVVEEKKQPVATVNEDRTEAEGGGTSSGQDLRTAPVSGGKRSVESLETDLLESDGAAKRKRRGDSLEDLVPLSFGHHFMSSVLHPEESGAAMRHKIPKMNIKPNRLRYLGAEKTAAVATSAISSSSSSSSSSSCKVLERGSPQLKTLCSCEMGSISMEGKVGLLCQGVEVVGGCRVGCRNKSTRSEVVKTSPEGDPLVLCDLHRDRLSSHGCCPVCGEFCSHGLVFMCRINPSSPPHMFHRSCYQMKPKEERCCPHCSSRRAPLAVQLKMSMSKTPLNLLQYTSKMSMPPSSPPSKLENGGGGPENGSAPRERWEVGLARERTVNYQLPGGRVISATGLPDGLEAERLDKILREFDNKNLVKHTTRNMYQPTAAGDNLKLLQLLSMDYSPRQKFSEANGGTPLHVAAGSNHVLTAHILVQAGAEVNAFDDSNETPLMIACQRGFANVTRYLVSAGAKVDLCGDDGMTALHFATQNGHVECAHIILGQNRLPRNFINSKDDGGWTPLVWACEHRHDSVIRYLLEQGADPFVTDVEMNISLHWAAFSGSREITDMLLSAGCPVNQANAIGETPLHIALRQDNYECALLLIARGARMDLPNNQGQLAANCMSGENAKIEGIIQLGTTLQKLMLERKQKFLTEKTVKQDISNGKENIPITAVNGEDFEMGPSDYVYVKNNVMTGNLPIDRNISKLQHCRCTNNCTSEDTCKCSDISVRSWYDQNGTLKEGFDFNEPPMIFECNDMCECNVSSCNNRVVQHGITARIQVYKTYGMGWGAKSLVDIPKGGFVCEYVGELISDAEAEQRENDSYLFDLENREGDTFCIDANKFGNVARFINHSCSPNLVPVKVFTSHQDLRFPHIALFASKNIKRGDVLGFDYGEKFWVIKHKFFTCWCGGEKCKYSKTAIGKTLESYYKKMDAVSPPPPPPASEKMEKTGKSGSGGKTSSKSAAPAQSTKSSNGMSSSKPAKSVVATTSSSASVSTTTKTTSANSSVATTTANTTTSNSISKPPAEEGEKQTGKLKLKLRMEEGKVVKVDDSGLLPDEPGVDRRSPKLDEVSSSSKASGSGSPKRESVKNSPKHAPVIGPMAKVVLVPVKMDSSVGKSSPKQDDRKSPILTIKTGPSSTPPPPPLENSGEMKEKKGKKVAAKTAEAKEEVKVKAADKAVVNDVVPAKEAVLPRPVVQLEKPGSLLKSMVKVKLRDFYSYTDTDTDTNSSSDQESVNSSNSSRKKKETRLSVESKVWKNVAGGKKSEDDRPAAGPAQKSDNAGKAGGTTRSSDTEGVSETEQGNDKNGRGPDERSATTRSSKPVRKVVEDRQKSLSTALAAKTALAPPPKLSSIEKSSVVRLETGKVPESEITDVGRISAAEPVAKSEVTGDVSSPTAPARRGRGRPPKKVAAATSNHSVDLSQQEEATLTKKETSVGNSGTKRTSAGKAVAAAVVETGPASDQSRPSTPGGGDGGTTPGGRPKRTRKVVEKD